MKLCRTSMFICVYTNPGQEAKVKPRSCNPQTECFPFGITECDQLKNSAVCLGEPKSNRKHARKTAPLHVRRENNPEKHAG